MKSIQRRFIKLKEKYPNLGDYTVFANAITGGNFSHNRIAREFNKLVPKDDYDKSDKKNLLEYLYILNGAFNRTKNGGIKPRGDAEKTKASIRLKKEIRPLKNKISITK